jgi:hypothetical protein
MSRNKGLASREADLLRAFFRFSNDYGSKPLHLAQNVIARRIGAAGPPRRRAVIMRH